jgi:hypothetical protein
MSETERMFSGESGGEVEGVKLNLGCGRWPMEGWVNVDAVELPGVDYVVDLDAGAGTEYAHSLTLIQLCSAVGGPSTPIIDCAESVSEFNMSHVLEHLHNPLPLMEACYYLAAPDATFTIACPYGSSDDADEDPTHVRSLYTGSFNYFAQPTYWRADYGYRGDWQPETIELKIPSKVVKACRNIDELQHRLLHDRNVVLEMVAVLRAVKPARAPTVKADMAYAELRVTEVVEE